MQRGKKHALRNQASQAERIVDILVNGRNVPREDADLIRRWLADADKENDKAAAFIKLFGDSLKYEANPVEAPLMWPELAKRLGIEYNVDTTRPVGRGRSGSLWRHLSYRVAAAVLIPVLAVAAWWGVSVYMTGRDEAGRVADLITVTVSAGESKTVLLPDGSRVTVRSGVMTYSGDFVENRRVGLNGEALFDVAKKYAADGEPQPFAVSTGNLTVNVLGTVFKVSEQSGEDKSIVALYEGSVSVENGELTQLARGDLYSYDHNTKTHTIGVIPAAEMLENGAVPILKFESSSLGNLVTAMQANYGVKFTIAEGIDPEKGRYSANFEGLTLDSALTMLSKTDPALLFIRNGEAITVIKR